MENNDFENLEELEETEVFNDEKTNDVAGEKTLQEESNELENGFLPEQEENVNPDEGSKEETKAGDQSEEVKINTLPNEIGRVKDVGADSVVIKITTNLPFESNLIDHHVIFGEGQESRIVGVVTGLNSEVANVKLIGEIAGVRFVPGVLKKPSMGSVCFVATEDEVKLIVVDDQNNVLKKVLIGNMPLYNNTPAYVPTNTFFSNHFAILVILVLVSLVGWQEYFKIFSLILKALPKTLACLFLMLMANMKARYQFQTTKYFLNVIQLT